LLGFVEMLMVLVVDGGVARRKAWPTRGRTRRLQTTKKPMRKEMKETHEGLGIFTREEET